jgi:hypothetical protein
MTTMTLDGPPGRRDLVQDLVRSLPPEAPSADGEAHGPTVLARDVLTRRPVHAPAAAERLPLRDGSCGGVILVASLGQVRRAEHTLSEVRPVLAQRGAALVDVPFEQGYHPSPGGHRRFGGQGLHALRQDMDLVVEDSSGVSGRAGPPVAGTARWLARVLIGPIVAPIKRADRWFDRHPMASAMASGVRVRARRPR